MTNEQNVCFVNISSRQCVSLFHRFVILASFLSAGFSVSAGIPAGGTSSGLFRIMPPGTALYTNESESKYVYPAESFLRPEDDVQFAVVAFDKSTANRKILFLTSRKDQPKREVFFENSAGIFVNLAYSRYCLAFSDSDERGFCRMRDIEFDGTASGFSLTARYSDGKSATNVGKLESSFEKISNVGYINIFRTTTPKKIYASPQYDAAIKKELAAKTFVATVSSHGDWLQVDVPDVDGSLVSGWLAMRDVVPTEWAAQKARDGVHTFRVGYSRALQDKAYAETTDDVEPDEEAGLYWEAIEVTSAASGAVQYIFDNTLEPVRAEPENLLTLIDVNFDGYLDLQLFGGTGGAGPNSSEKYYLYDAKTRRFEPHDQLSGMTQLQIDAKNKTVLTAWRASCCEHGWEKYRWRKGELIKISSGGDRYFSDGKHNYVEISEGRLRRGRWKERTFRKISND